MCTFDLTDVHHTTMQRLTPPPPLLSAPSCPPPAQVLLGLGSVRLIPLPPPLPSPRSSGPAWPGQRPAGPPPSATAHGVARREGQGGVDGGRPADGRYSGGVAGGIARGPG